MVLKGVRLVLDRRPGVGGCDSQAATGMDPPVSASSRTALARLGLRCPDSHIDTSASEKPLAVENVACVCPCPCIHALSLSIGVCMMRPA